MGTRTLRIPAEHIPARVTELTGKRVQVLRRDGTTLAGTLQSLNPGGLTLTDPNIAWYNRRKHTHLIPLTEVREIILDLLTEY